MDWRPIPTFYLTLSAGTRYLKCIIPEMTTEQTLLMRLNGLAQSTSLLKANRHEETNQEKISNIIILLLKEGDKEQD